ncbi:MAG: DUF3108 domain-containing protein [Candidatus Omnitrophica bacterium]|nr:DUF3108 domain-containing protein [Candidatus Omnitrophota bacterium]
MNNISKNMTASSGPTSLTTNPERSRRAGLRSLALAALFFVSTPVSAADAPAKFPFSPGETIQYDIKKFRMKAGEATLTFHGLVSLEGQGALLITFTSKGLKFFDDEKIYIDPRTFLPKRVERDLDIFGKKEKIVEHYNAKEETVRVVKTARGETTEQVIKRSVPLDNIYCFIFRYRTMRKFTAGETLLIHLPTKDVQFQAQELRRLQVGEKEVDAYYMQSESAQYRVWFDTGAHKVPLRIDGAIGFGNTAMILRSYTASNSLTSP